MLKYLLLLIVGWAVWWAWKKGKEAQREVEDAERQHPKPSLPERMVTCAYCGVHLPESDALAADGQHYCHEAHRQAAFSREK
jgi:uncharacterized protein